MSQNLQAVRGMPDILPPETQHWQFFEAIWQQVMWQYGYQEIRMPIAEATELFKRSIGDETDIVGKEMYTFSDRDKRSITLRPEGTASCVRAALEHGMLHNQTQRLWYQGPMFRHERAQKGRYRQFHQVGVEAFGLAGPDVDVEQILLMARLFKTMGVDGAIKLEINSLGDQDARSKHREDLVNYFQQYKNELDETEQQRLERNPLRLLDSKNPKLADMIQQAPKIIDYLEPESLEHFEQFKTYLDALDVAYEVNPCLVRGLDYYNRTVYEWTTNELGAQGTVCAGGRYDGLVQQLGGKATTGVGFAMGIERLLLVREKVMDVAYRGADVYIICVGDGTRLPAMRLAENLREQCPELNVICHVGGGSFKSQFKKADQSQAKIALVLGDDELSNQTVGVKFLREERAQMSIEQANISQYVGGYFQTTQAI